jgi:hypothetical protein
MSGRAKDTLDHANMSGRAKDTLDHANMSGRAKDPLDHAEMFGISISSRRPCTQKNLGETHVPVDNADMSPKAHSHSDHADMSAKAHAHVVHADMSGEHGAAHLLFFTYVLFANSNTESAGGFCQLTIFSILFSTTWLNLNTHMANNHNWVN